MSDLPSSPLRPRPDPRSLLSAEQVAGVPTSTGTSPSDAALHDALAENLQSAAPTGTMPRQGDQDAWSEGVSRGMAANPQRREGYTPIPHSLLEALVGRKCEGRGKDLGQASHARGPVALAL